MSDKVIKALDHQFSHYRILFWYDKDEAMREIFDQYQVPLDGIKLEIQNNEFHLRYQLLKEFPEKKALVYSPEEKPADEDNWLLDMNLAYFVFASDEAAMVQQELDISDTFLPLLRSYGDFFRNRKERMDPLKVILQPKQENEETLKIAMMSVLCGDHKAERERRRSFPEIVLNIFLDCSEKGDLYKDFQKYQLDQDFWAAVQKEFGYSGTSDPDAFLNDCLMALYEHQLGHDRDEYTPSLYAHFDNWRKNQDYCERVQQLLDQKEQELNIKHRLKSVKSLDDLLAMDLFKENDRTIFYSIYHGIIKNTMETSQALQHILKRRETYWYKSSRDGKLQQHYLLLQAYLMFKEQLNRFRPEFKTLAEGWDQYTQHYFKLDQEYRTFLRQYHQLNISGKFDDLMEKIEKEYSQLYLQVLADQWHSAMDKDMALKDLDSYRMSGFFQRFVTPYLAKDQSVFLLISDGFRYEMGAELADTLLERNRFQVERFSLCAPTPSYTQVGMASLLPHSSLSIESDGDKVLVDGKSTTGWSNRIKIIQQWLDQYVPGKKVCGMAAKDFRDLPRSEQNDFIRGIDLIILYTSGADAVGDNVKTEENLPKAADEEIQTLLDHCGNVCNNLSRAHILITGDHGFLFRHQAIPDTERCSLGNNENTIRKDHRFLFSHNPESHPSADILEPDQVCWEAPFKVQVARGEVRFRSQGGGTRYVHGGRMPQELCVPVLRIRKTRSDDVSQVDVSVLDRQTRITTGQVNVTFFQERSVDPKNSARELEVVFVGTDGKEISNSIKLIFDSSDPIEQNRYRKESFKFSTLADKYNGKNITLRLQDIRSGHTLVVYKEYSYHLQKKLQMEIDF